MSYWIYVTVLCGRARCLFGLLLILSIIVAVLTVAAYSLDDTQGMKKALSKILLLMLGVALLSGTMLCVVPTSEEAAIMAVSHMDESTPAEVGEFLKNKIMESRRRHEKIH